MDKHHKRWTEMDDAYLHDMYSKGVDADIIAGVLGRSTSAIYKRAWSLKIDRPDTNQQELPLEVVQGELDLQHDSSAAPSLAVLGEGVNQLCDDVEKEFYTTDWDKQFMYVTLTIVGFVAGYLVGVSL